MSRAFRRANVQRHKSQAQNKAPLNYHFHAVKKPSEDKCKPLRLIAVRVVRESHPKPMHIREIRSMVRKYIAEQVNVGLWDVDELGIPGHNTIERRINECADSRMWEDEPTPLVHVGDKKSPMYGLNAKRFPELFLEVSK